MTARYHAVWAQAGPHTVARLRTPGAIDAIELVFGTDTDHPGGHARPPAVCGVDIERARELAFELLVLAEVVEEWEQAR